MLFKSDLSQYEGMNIFKEAAQSKKDGLGYRARRHATLWQSKKRTWNRLFIEAGIRYSDVWQVFPVWNSSHNQQRGLLFGVWLLYFEVGYYRKHWCYHRPFFEKLPFQRCPFLKNMYRLIF